jgi:hypothetical protein
MQDFGYVGLNVTEFFVEKKRKAGKFGLGPNKIFG